MRTTIALDDDIFLYARAQAQHERISLGEAVSRLARRGIAAQASPVLSLAEPASRYALLPARDETITPAHVRTLMDQEGI